MAPEGNPFTSSIHADLPEGHKQSSLFVIGLRPASAVEDQDVVELQPLGTVPREHGLIVDDDVGAPARKPRLP